MTLQGSKFHQMVPNLKGNGMVSIKKYQGGLWIIFIVLYNYATLFGDDDKKGQKLLGNCSEIPPRV